MSADPAGGRSLCAAFGQLARRGLRTKDEGGFSS